MAKTANMHVMIYLAFLFKVSYPFDLWNGTLLEKAFMETTPFLWFSLCRLEKWKKCDSRKVRKWHVTIYFYIKRIFICLNSLFPSFCFCNLVNINFTHKINSSITKENMVNGNIHWVFGFINCFTYFIFNLWFFTAFLPISIQ